MAFTKQRLSVAVHDSAAQEVTAVAVSIQLRPSTVINHECVSAQTGCLCRVRLFFFSFLLRLLFTSASADVSSGPSISPLRGLLGPAFVLQLCSVRRYGGDEVAQCKL
eukprot:scaffold12227_cov65-Phaeocystis_antarctica.AAC.5